MPRHDYARGRLVTPSPGLEAVYTSLGGSNTHCEVRPFTGGSYICESSDPLDDSERHLDAHYRVITCPSCLPGWVRNGRVEVAGHGQWADNLPVPTRPLGWIVADGFRVPIVSIRFQRGMTEISAEHHGPFPQVDVPSFDILDEDGGLMWHVRRALSWEAGFAGTTLTVCSSLVPPVDREAPPVD